MANISNYLEEKILTDNLITPSVKLALYTTDPTDANTGTEVSTSGTAYARQDVDFKEASPFQQVGKATIMNDGDILFPIATASWGEIGWVGIHNAASPYELLYHGVLDDPKTIASGDQFKIVDEDLVLNID